MCFLLTISIPGQTFPVVLNLNRREVHIAAHSNPSITRLNPEGWSSFAVTTGGCSYNLYRSEIAAQRRKQGAIPFAPSGLRKDIVDVIRNLTTAYRQIRLSLHFYSGSFDSESFQLSERGTLSLVEFEKGNPLLAEEITILIDASDKRPRRRQH